MTVLLEQTAPARRFRPFERLDASPLSPRPKAMAADESGQLGMVGAFMRQAIEDAQGISDRFGKWQDPEEARRYLRSAAWEPLVSGLGCGPATIRAALEQRFEWMKQ